MDPEKTIVEAALKQKEYPITSTPDGAKTDPTRTDFLRRDRWWEFLERKKERSDHGR